MLSPRMLNIQSIRQCQSLNQPPKMILSNNVQKWWWVIECDCHLLSGPTSAWVIVGTTFKEREDPVRLRLGLVNICQCPGMRGNARVSTLSEMWCDMRPLPPPRSTQPPTPPYFHPSSHKKYKHIILQTQKIWDMIYHLFIPFALHPHPSSNKQKHHGDCKGLVEKQKTTS